MAKKNIIETVKDIVQSFPKISELCDVVHVDFADVEDTSYGLSSMGDSKIIDDVTGRSIRQHTFMLYATYSALSDYERITNSGLLLELAIWLENQVGAEIEQPVLNDTYIGEIERITTANGSLLAVPQGELADAVQYQLQIVVNYTLEEE